MSKNILCLIFICLFLNCSKTIVVDQEKLRDIPNIHKADLFLKSGKKLRIDYLGSDSGNILYTDNEKEMKWVHFSQVDSIVKTKHGKGMLKGMGVGLLTGIVFGITFGVTYGDDPPCDDNNSGPCIRSTAEDKAVFGSFVFGGLGMILGIPIGGIVGSKEIYRFKDAPSFK